MPKKSSVLYACSSLGYPHSLVPDGITPLGALSQEGPTVSFTPVQRVQRAASNASDQSDFSLGYRGNGKWSGSIGQGNLCSIPFLSVEPPYKISFSFCVLIFIGASGLALSSLLTPTVIDTELLPTFSPNAPACATVLFNVPSSPGPSRLSSPAPDVDLTNVLFQLAELRAMVERLRTSYTDLERSVVSLELRALDHVPLRKS